MEKVGGFSCVASEASDGKTDSVEIVLMTDVSENGN